MKKKQIQEDTFLARWIANKLTDKELSEFKSDEDYRVYQAINNIATQLEPPTYQKNKAFAQIQQKAGISCDISKKPKKASVIRSLNLPYWTYALAACLVVVLATFVFSSKTTVIQTSYQQKTMVFLPDSSQVILNANATLSYNADSWEDNREVFLKGNAFFKVKKGSSFKVVSTDKKQQVKVLGTSFDVSYTPLFTQVACYTGKVQVTTPDAERFLSPKQAFRAVGTQLRDWSFSEKEPSWLTGESSFKAASLAQVITSLQNQFGIIIEVSDIDVNQEFTGSYTHTNLTTALQTVFVPMEILFTFRDKKTVVLAKE